MRTRLRCIALNTWLRWLVTRARGRAGLSIVFPFRDIMTRLDEPSHMAEPSLLAPLLDLEARGFAGWLDRMLGKMG